jgi:single-stranded DNA-binding protein
VLARDAEQKTSKAGKPYLRFTLRVGDGEQAQFVSVMYFGDADTKAMVKGARVYVEGSVKLDEWTAREGTKRTGLSCMSWHARVAAIGSNRPKRESAAPQASGSAAAAYEMNDEIPFGPEWR